MAESFYGGKAGFPFVIVKAFKAVNKETMPAREQAGLQDADCMVTQFKKGPDYTDVHFNEYVLINTENRNNKHNGEVYRRGYDYTNSMGGAIYVGRIVGPAGPAPMLELADYDDVVAKENESKTEYSKHRFKKGEYRPDSAHPETADIIPGKKEDGTFNDNIMWASCCLMDADYNESTAYIGFKIPYLVNEFTAESESPYYNRDKENTADFKNINLITRTDDKQHPFYEKWDIKVPKGIKGDSLQQLRAIPAATDTVENYTGKEEDIGGIDGDPTHPRQILVYDLYNYDAKEEGDKTTYYAGDYNVVDDVIIENDGTTKVKFTHKDTHEFQFLIRWVERIYLNDTGEDADYLFHVVYNNNNHEDVALGDPNNPVNYIEDTVINKENYHFLVQYSNRHKQGNTVYNDKNTWKDLGSIKDESGILVGLNIKPSDHPEEQLTVTSKAIEYLNKTYPQGLTASATGDLNKKGKVVVMGEDYENKKFYAFDYDDNKWFYLGTLDIPWVIVSEQTDPTLEDKKNKLAFGGVWFKLED